MWNRIFSNEFLNGFLFLHMITLQPLWCQIFYEIKRDYWGRNVHCENKESSRILIAINWFAILKLQTHLNAKVTLIEVHHFLWISRFLSETYFGFWHYQRNDNRLSRWKWFATDSTHSLLCVFFIGSITYFFEVCFFSETLFLIIKRKNLARYCVIL